MESPIRVAIETGMASGLAAGAAATAIDAGFRQGATAVAGERLGIAGCGR